jgi:hypothetical protein
MTRWALLGILSLAWLVGGLADGVPWLAIVAGVLVLAAIVHPWTFGDAKIPCGVMWHDHPGDEQHDCARDNGHAGPCTCACGATLDVFNG